MQLSPEAKEIQEFLPKHCSKLIAEFGGHDVDKLRNDIFIEVEKGGYTICRFPPNDYTTLSLGRNWRINRWKIIKRTPKSYWVEYYYTTIICCSGSPYKTCYKYNTTIPNLKGKQKRVFPLRRIRDRPQWEMQNDLLHDENKHCIAQNVSVEPIPGGFRLSFK